VVDLFADVRLNHHTRVESGILAEDCGGLLKRFFEAKRMLA
jgi:tRNA(adenine34) deaminase